MSDLRLLRDEGGATAIEYGLIAALVSIAALAAMQGIGSTVTNTFTNVGAAMQASTP